MPLPLTQRYGKALGTRRPPDAPAWIDAIDNPYLHGHFAPVQAEGATGPLPIQGELPRDLRGAYFRNGPNPQTAPRNRYHWFDGDGMVHGLILEGGQARYLNRAIETAGYAAERARGEAIWPGVLGPFEADLPGGPLKDTANTDLIVRGGQLYALWYESGALHALDPRSLATRGVETFGGALPQRISAHSKVDPATGDLIYFGYGDTPPYMTYGVLRPDGTAHHTPITLPGPRRPHDLGVTPNHSILHDFPVFFDPDYFARTGKRVPLFHPEVPTRFGVIPRFGADADVRWFDFAPCYMLHVVNCWEEGDEVVMIGCRTDDPTLRPDRADGPLAGMLAGLKLQANLYAWRMNLRTGATAEAKLDDTNAEFPMINPGRLGQPSRYAWLQHIPHEIPAAFEGLVKYDHQTGATERFAYGPGVFGSEAPFAPRPGATAEDDGYLLTFVTDTADFSSACWIFHGQHIAQGPICKIPLPRRVPAGFHATWLPGEALP